MSTITKERIANLIDFNSEGSDCQANAEQWEVNQLARIAQAVIGSKEILQVFSFQRWRDVSKDVFEAQTKDGCPGRILYTAPPVPTLSIDKVKLGEWLDSEVGGVRPEQYDYYLKSFYENVMPVPLPEEEQCKPHPVMALLDELEAKEKYAKDRDAENEDLMLTVGRLRVEREAAEKRIADLEAREVVLPSTQDVHPFGPQSAKIFCEFHRSIVNRCADEIRKVGVKVSIKGN